MADDDRVEQARPPQNGGAKFYRFEDRVQCDLEAALAVGEESAAQVQFAERGEIGVRILDMSPGGLRVWSRVFVPVGAEVAVRVTSAGGVQASLVCRVKRNQMVERTPAYSLGLAITDESSKVRAVLAALAAQPARGGRGVAMLARDDFVFVSLVESGVISAEDAARAERAASETRARPSEAAVTLGLIDTRTLAIGRAETSEYPYVRLADFKINFQNAALLARSVAESLRAFPLFTCPGLVTVGMEDPLDFRAVDQLRALLRSDVAPVVCDREELRTLIERAYGITLGGRDVADRPVSVQADLAKGDEPIVVAVNSILAQGVDMGASDIHIGPDEHELQLRFRVDGVLRRVAGPALDAHTGIVQRLKVMADLDLTEARRPQDGKFRFSHRGREVDVRASLVPTVHGENVVLRLLSSASSIRGFEELGFPAEELGALREIIERPHGMLLVTGPTGSGKTTTLYTALKTLNSPDVNIMTIEDPVEIPMPLMRQVQVNAQIGMTFASALRSILRQDPDVVFVGEIRDEETARISVQAALTGHLLLSSLHTNDAAGAVPRLHDLGVPAFAINAALMCVVAQRLVRRVCADCAKAHTPPRVILSRFGDIGDPAGFRMGAGCARCAGQGLRGRLGLFEMMTMSEGVRRAIERDAGMDQIARAARESGMREMWRDGLDKARLGLTTLEEVARVVALGEADTIEPTRREAA